MRKIHTIPECLVFLILITIHVIQWQIQGGAQDPPPPLFLDQTEATLRRLRPEGPKKIFFETGPPFPKGLDDQAPPPLT